MTAATVSSEVGKYLTAVRAALADLPPAERDDLVAEVEASLADVAAEGTTPLAARLGPPEEFAAELRSAAGLHEQARAAPRESQLAVRMREATARVVADPRVVQVRRLATELAPIWWVARAYLAVGAAAYVLDTGWSTRYPVVPRFGSAEAGVALIVLATIASVALGLWLRGRAAPVPRLVAALNAALVIAIVPVALDVSDTRAHDMLVSLAYAPQPETSGLQLDGEPVSNIYPYSRDGKLLHDVLLYDGRGQPLTIPGDRVSDPDRRVVTTNGNEPLWNVFPIRYYEPGTRRVERPNAAPYVKHPLVVTPPLPSSRQPRP